MRTIPKKTVAIIGLVYLYLNFVAVSAMAISHIQKRRQRRWKTRPINKKRKKEGLFATLVKDMWIKDSDQFFQYSRMNRSQFSFLLRLVMPGIQKSSKKEHISPAQRLIITLHYLAEGCSMQDIASGYRIGKATAHVIIKETCCVLWEKLQPTELPVPTRDMFEQIELDFFNRWNIPNCIGAVDGRHVDLISPNYSGSSFINHKKDFSIVVMATCDAFYRFNMVDIGAEGCNHDSPVFKASGFGSALLTGNLEIPPPKNLQNTIIKLPHFLVAKAAFPSHENIIKPYPGKDLGDAQNIFNYRISKAGRCIENAFGILSQRWGILRRPINASVEVSELIVQATIVLHNYLQNREHNLPPEDRKYCPAGYADYYDENGLLHEGAWRLEGNNLRSVRRMGVNNFANRANNNKDQLADFFVSKDGWIPCQENIEGVEPERLI